LEMGGREGRRKKEGGEGESRPSKRGRKSYGHGAVYCEGHLPLKEKRKRKRGRRKKEKFGKEEEKKKGRESSSGQGDLI